MSSADQAYRALRSQQDGNKVPLQREAGQFALSLGPLEWETERTSFSFRVIPSSIPLKVLFDAPNQFEL